MLLLFALCDEILRQAVEGISNIITMPGIINVDFADIKSSYAERWFCINRISSAVGENRAVEGATNAIIPHY